MPSYYNHSNRSAGNQDNKISFSDDDLEVSSKEINKLKVKIFKTTTNKTRLEIAEAIQKSVSYVDDLWKEVREEEKFKLEEEVDEQIRKQIREYEIMKVELWEAWRESKKDWEKEKHESGSTSKGDIDKITSESGGRLAKIEYMTEIRMINTEIANLLGITKKMEVNFNQQNNQISVVSAGPTLVPEEHNAFTKKPKQLQGDQFTGIEEAEAEDVSDNKTGDGPPEDIDDF